MPHIAFDSFFIVALPGWEDITDTVEADAPPFTLARGDGVGALQFSVALYIEGPVPDPPPAYLAEMLATFAECTACSRPARSPSSRSDCGSPPAVSPGARTS